MVDAPGIPMRPLKALLALSLAALFVLPPGLAAPGGEDAGVHARSEYKQQNPAEVELKQSGNVYSSSGFVFPLPANATINSASVDLQGRYVKLPQTTFSTDYNDEAAGNRAFTGIVSDFAPGHTHVAGLQGGEFQSADYDAVKASDDDWVANMGDFSGNNDGYQLFKFKTPVDESSSVTVSWEGHAQSWSGSASEFTLYLWNNLSGMWELLDIRTSSTDVQVDMRKDGDWYCDNRSVYILAICTDGYYILTDYVNVTVQGYPYSYPRNPLMDIGGNGIPEWSWKETKFDYMATVFEPKMITELEQFARNPPGQIANITIKFTSETAGKIRITNLTVNYSAPPWCRPITEIFRIDEDSTVARVLDLNAYFVDDRDSGSLTYQVSYQQDPKRAQAVLDPDNHTLGFKTITRNWWGTLNFRVRATDLEGLSSESGNFTLSVLPVNDVPVIPQILEQRATQGVPFILKVTARDIDTDLDPNETVTYSDNATFFEIDHATGWINFTPRQSDVGDYYIGVTATDPAGAVGTQNFTMIVEDAEDPPVMKAIPDLKAVEGEYFSYNVSVSDPDIPYGDRLNFTDDCPLFVINPSTGEISFTPTIAQVAFYHGNITVKDQRGSSDRKPFNLSVLNSIGTFDHPPEVEAVPNFTAVEGVPFFWQVNASDPDPEDIISFKDNCPAFVVGASNGTISFTPRTGDIGVYNVRITVSDWEGLEAVAAFRLTIIKFNHAPNITAVKPRPGTKTLVDHEVVLDASATDPDGDRLTYSWFEGDRVLGRGSSIVTMFNGTGTHTITLVVTDGKAEVNATTHVRIVTKLDEGKKSPGFGWVLAALSILIVFIGVNRRRR